jgi:hypothetical protein
LAQHVSADTVAGMSWKPSDRIIQVAVGLLLITVSSFFLWRDTLRPISKGLRRDGVLSGHLKQGLLYLTGQSEGAAEDALNREKEKLRIEEQVLQEKLEQLRKKRESLTPVKTADPAPEKLPPQAPEKPSPPPEEPQN